MERGEQEPFKTINWLRDEDDYYFNLKTQSGIYDIRPENTAIFRFGDCNLDHIYRITDDSGEQFMGFRLYRYQLEEFGYNFDQVCSDMMNRDFECIYEEEPNQEEIDAYINAGNEYTPTRKLPSVEVGLLNFDAEFNYYLGDENGEWRI